MVGAQIHLDFSISKVLSIDRLCLVRLDYKVWTVSKIFLTVARRNVLMLEIESNKLLMFVGTPSKRKKELKNTEECEEWAVAYCEWASAYK